MDSDFQHSQGHPPLTVFSVFVRWWRELGLVEKLSFARDRPLERYLWTTVGIFWEPLFSKCQIEMTKAIVILLVVDDMYDSYVPLDELVLFINAIQRWDLDAMEHLPEYMKICYMALYNTANEIGYRVLKEHGWSITHHLRRTDEQEHGDVASSMECYMRENGVSLDENARKHVGRLIHNLWKELNGELLAQTPIPSAITAQIIYQHGDDDRFFGVEDHIQSLIVKPIMLHDIFIGPESAFRME